MFQRCIREIEVNAFQQQVGADHGLLAEMIDNGGIIPHAKKCTGIHGLIIASEVLDESKLAEGSYFCSLGFHAMCISCLPHQTRWQRDAKVAQKALRD